MTEGTAPKKSDVMFTRVETKIKLKDNSHLEKRVLKFYYLKPTTKGIIVRSMLITKEDPNPSFLNEILQVTQDAYVGPKH